MGDLVAYHVGGILVMIVGGFLYGVAQVSTLAAVTSVLVGASILWGVVQWVLKLSYQCPVCSMRQDAE